MRRRWGWGLAAAAVAGVGWMGWLATDASSADSTVPVTAAGAATPSALSARTGGTASAPTAGAPFSAAGLLARQEQRVLWQERLERSKSVLEAYRQSTRYPHGSQPASEHADQMHPNETIRSELALLKPDGKAAAGVRLVTSQQRVFVQGNESVRFTVSVRDSTDQALPLRILRAAARELPAPNTAANYPEAPLVFNDDGTAGDLAAADGVYSTQLQPATQGFNGLLGQIRVDVALQVRDQQGSTYFDIVYSADPPATWQGGVREAVDEGSLVFMLKAKVVQPGRYVVTGRVDDADGKPLALLSFNDELAAGAQEVRLTLFGKLLRDAKPAFPLTLRDVDAFLLRADAFPDRVLMPRLQGRQHTTQSYPLVSFADAEWTSEERSRYLAELTRDVTDAQNKVDQLGKGP
jgi:hypothetical protein